MFFKAYDSFIKEDIAVIYITSNTINKDYESILDSLKEDIISHDLSDNDTITIKIKNYHIHKEDIINFQKNKLHDDNIYSI